MTLNVAMTLVSIVIGSTVGAFAAITADRWRKQHTHHRHEFVTPRER